MATFRSDGAVRNQNRGVGQVGNEMAIPTSAAEEFAAPRQGQAGKARANRPAPKSANSKPNAASTRAAATTPTASTAGAAMNALAQPDSTPAARNSGNGGPTHGSKYASRTTTRAYGRKPGRSSRRARA